MTDRAKGDNSQQALWNGDAAQAWVEAQGVPDQMFRPFEDRLVEAVAAQPGNRILDIGCGTGSVIRAAARRLGQECRQSVRCTGVDISEAMIAAARAIAAREGVDAHFIRADAQTHDFAPESFDMIVSRFGVMFFDDPVAAFANLRRSVCSGGALRFAAWRSAQDNPFMTAAERAAAPFVPQMPVRQPDAPGQFGFADQHRVARILKECGWRDIEVAPIDVACAIPKAALDGYITRLGPLGRIMPQLDEATRDKVIDFVRAAFAPFVQADEVRFIAACWMVAARA